MARKFTRNITGTSLREDPKEPLHTNKQNDLLSDDEDVFVRNKDEYHCLTDNIKEITSPNIIINRIDKNTVEIISTGDSEGGGDFVETKLIVKENSKEYLEVTNPRTNEFELGLTTDFISKFEHIKNIIDNLPDMSNYYNKEEIDRIINEWHTSLENVQSDWNETDTSSDSYIKNKPEIPNLDDFEKPVQSDWNVNDSTDLSYIKNKPTIPEPPNMDDYYNKEEVDNKIDGIDTGDFEQVQTDWDETDIGSPSFIKNKPTIPEPPNMDDYYNKEEVDSKIDEIETGSNLENKNRASIVGLKLNLETNMLQVQGRRFYSNGLIRNIKLIVDKSRFNTTGGSVNNAANDLKEYDIGTNLTFTSNYNVGNLNHTMPDNSSANDFINNVQSFVDESKEKLVRVPVYVKYDTKLNSPSEEYYTKDSLTMIVYRTENDQIEDGGFEQVQSDWNETDNTKPSFIANKPTIPEIPEIPEFPNMDDYYNKEEIDDKFTEVDSGYNVNRLSVISCKYNIADSKIQIVFMNETLISGIQVKNLKVYIPLIDYHKNESETDVTKYFTSHQDLAEYNLSGNYKAVYKIVTNSSFKNAVSSYVTAYEGSPNPIQIPVTIRCNSLIPHENDEFQRNTFTINMLIYNE